MGDARDILERLVNLLTDYNRVYDSNMYSVRKLIDVYNLANPQKNPIQTTGLRPRGYKLKQHWDNNDKLELYRLVYSLKDIELKTYQHAFDYYMYVLYRRLPLLCVSK